MRGNSTIVGEREERFPRPVLVHMCRQELPLLPAYRRELVAQPTWRVRHAPTGLTVPLSEVGRRGCADRSAAESVRQYLKHHDVLREAGLMARGILVASEFAPNDVDADVNGYVVRIYRTY